MDRLPWALCAIYLLFYWEITFDFSRNASPCQFQTPCLDCNKTFSVIWAFTLSHHGVRFYLSCTPWPKPLQGRLQACVSAGFWVGKAVRVDGVDFHTRTSRWGTTRRLCPLIDASPLAGESKHHLQTSGATPELQSTNAPCQISPCEMSDIVRWLWRASKLPAPLHI